MRTPSLIFVLTVFCGAAATAQVALPADAVATLTHSAAGNGPARPLELIVRHKETILITIILLSLLPWQFKWRQSAKQRKMRQVSGDPVYFDALLTVMFHVARADGVITPAALDTIKTVYANLTGSKVTADMTASHASQRISDHGILSIIQTYRGQQAGLILDAAILTAVQNDCIPRDKHPFLTSMSAVLDCEAGWFDRNVATMLCPKRRARAKLTADADMPPLVVKP